MHTKNKKVHKTISTFKERLLLKLLIIAKNAENIITKNKTLMKLFSPFLETKHSFQRRDYLELARIVLVS